jgi:hypothetical protein
VESPATLDDRGVVWAVQAPNATARSATPKRT